MLSAPVAAIRDKGIGPEGPPTKAVPVDWRTLPPSAVVVVLAVGRRGRGRL
ncbi:DUF6053 domain-containing protein [Lysobacter enzymogenes]|uniref:DUF6053 domain-containing protein n=1 Tax=Lysobacter enzymogenes TaxID=69 RepID=UPI003D18EB8C